VPVVLAFVSIVLIIVTLEPEVRTVVAFALKARTVVTLGPSPADNKLAPPVLWSVANTSTVLAFFALVPSTTDVELESVDTEILNELVSFPLIKTNVDVCTAAVVVKICTITSRDTTRLMASEFAKLCANRLLKPGEAISCATASGEFVDT